MINFSSLRLNNSIQFLNNSSIRIGLKFLLLHLESNFSENLLFLSSKENPDSFVFHFATWFSFLVRTKFAYGSPRTSVCEKGLSWQQTFFMRVISLSPVRWFFSLLKWTVVKIALFRWSHRRVRHHTSTKAPYLCRRTHPGRSLQKSLSGRTRRGAWAHNLWEDGKTPWGKTPHLAEAQWF